MVRMRERERSIGKPKPISNRRHAGHGLADLLVQRQRGVQRMIDAVGADMKPSSDESLNRGRSQVWLTINEGSGGRPGGGRDQLVQHGARFVSNRPDPRLEVSRANLV